MGPACLSKKGWLLSPCSHLTGGAGRFVGFTLLALLLLAGTASAQVTINSSPNPVGSGARALGMGGAFVAVADDATAASWNPGGLTQLERPELGAVYSWKFYRENFTSKPHPEIDGAHEVDLNDVNYLSFVYPIPWTPLERNLVLSLNYQKKYDFDRSLDFPFRKFSLDSGLSMLTRYDIKYSQLGSLSAFSPAFAFELFKFLSLGVAVNIWDQSLIPDNEWKTRIATRGGGYYASAGGGGGVGLGRIYTMKDYENFHGINYTFGMLIKPIERLQFGMVYHTKFTADVDYSEEVYSLGLGQNMFFLPRRGKANLKMTFPSAIGMGVAYRFPNDRLTVALDVTRRNWDEAVTTRDSYYMFPEFYGNAFGVARDRVYARRFSNVSSAPKYLSPHDPTYTVRAGAEYVFVNQKKPKQDYLPSLRGGLFYDPEPSADFRSTGATDIIRLRKGRGNVDNYYGFALGTGVLIKNRVNLDLAYQFRWGNNVRSDTLSEFRGTTLDVVQHSVYLSTVVYF